MNEVAQGANGSGRLVVQDDAVALFDTAKFEHMYRIAKLMASSDLVPVHLKGKEANCMLITQQALRWQMDPFALAVGTFVVSNKLGYEGKVIAGVVNTRARLKERLKYDISGAGQKCSVVVRGTFEGENEERTVNASWAEGSAMSPHGAKWKQPGMEDQQLCYYAVRKWARRHCPELILGVLSDDEVQAMSQNVGPDYAKAVGGHSEVPKAVNLKEEGVKGGGETAPMTEAGVVHDGLDPRAPEILKGSQWTEEEQQRMKDSGSPPADFNRISPDTKKAKSAAMPETTEAPGTPNAGGVRRPRVKLMWQGAVVYQTGFLHDLKEQLAAVQTWEDLEQLSIKAQDAILTADPAHLVEKVRDQAAALIKATEKEFESDPDPETKHDPETGEIHDPNPAQTVAQAEELDLA